MCACVSGFVCMNEACDHCEPLKSCRAGEGVIQEGRSTSVGCRAARAHSPTDPRELHPLIRWFVCLLLAATRTTNTVCAPCRDGTYSNVTDSQSECRRHTRSVAVRRLSVHSVCPSTSAFWGTQSVSSCSDRV